MDSVSVALPKNLLIIFISTLDKGHVEWESLSPSLAECQSKWLHNLDARLRDGESIRTVSSDLAQMSALQTMYGGDLQLSTRMLKHMAERMHFDIQSVVRLEERERMVTELVQNIVMTGSNILDREALQRRSLKILEECFVKRNLEPVSIAHYTRPGSSIKWPPQTN